MGDCVCVCYSVCMSISMPICGKPDNPLIKRTCMNSYLPLGVNLILTGYQQLYDQSRHKLLPCVRVLIAPKAAP